MLNYQQYKIILNKEKIESLEMILPQCRKLKTFIKPSTLNRVPKIYIIKNKSKIAYVGITTQGISNRLRHGFNANGRNGYYGYKWSRLKKIDLCVFFFKDIERVEAIEAEIVYLIRNKTGFWPEYQTEIHFHNATDEEKKIAKRIYDKIRVSR